MKQRTLVPRDNQLSDTVFLKFPSVLSEGLVHDGLLDSLVKKMGFGTPWVQVQVLTLPLENCVTKRKSFLSLSLRIVDCHTRAKPELTPGARGVNGPSHMCAHSGHTLSAR